MKRIVAGGTGFIGKHLVNQWLNDGHEIIVVGRSKQKINEIFGDKVTASDWNDVKENGTQLLENAEVIVNLTGKGIGSGRWTPALKKEILDSRIQSTETFSKLCAELGEQAPALFNTSAIGTYGLQQNADSGLPPALDENTKLDFSKSTDFLSEIGHAWELATQTAKDAGVRVVNMRFGVVFANDGGVLPKLTLPFKFFMGGKIGSGKQPFSWITVEDLISAIDFLLQHKEVNGPVNLVAPECVIQMELAKAIGKALHRPSFYPTPGFVFKTIYGTMADELLLHGQHVKPTRLNELGFKFEYPDLDSALKHVFK